MLISNIALGKLYFCGHGVRNGILTPLSKVIDLCEGKVDQDPVNSPHKGQWRGALMFSLICVWINGWVNDREAGYYDVIVMLPTKKNPIEY